jgi:hypothetical protein
MIVQRVINLRYLLKVSILTLLFVLPVFVRNLILSGYLLFPSPALDVFMFDWKVPEPIVRSTIDWISNIGMYKFTNTVNDETRMQFTGMLDSRRLALIWNIFTDNAAKFGLLTFIVISAISLMAYFLLCKVRSKNCQWVLIIFSIVFVLQFSVCYIVSPMIRYAFGYIGVAIILPLTLVLSSFLPALKNSRLFLWCVVGFMLFLVTLMIYKPSIPIPVRKYRFAYPIKVVGEFVRNFTYFPELIKGKQKTYVINKRLKINVSQYDYEYAKLERIGPGAPYYKVCTKVDFLDIDKTIHGNCEAYNAFVATMTWMDPLPSVGAIYRGTSLRGKHLQDGFRIDTSTRMKVDKSE